MVAWSRAEFTPGDRELAAVGAMNIAAVEKVKTLNGLVDMDYEEYFSTMEDIKEWTQTQK